jgi:ribosomal protein S18 acetylase RimI-like enzyme
VTDAFRKPFTEDDLADAMAFIVDHACSGIDLVDARRILTTLVRGSDAVIDLHDKHGRLALAAVVDTCANVDDSADLAILALGGGELAESGVRTLLECAEAATRRGPRSALDVALAPERADWKQLLVKRGYEPAYALFRMECAGDASLLNFGKPLPKGWHWVEVGDDQIRNYHRVVSQAFSDVPGAFVPSLAEMTTALKNAPWRPSVLMGAGGVRAFVTVRVHERSDGAAGEVKTIGRDPALRGTGLGEHALRHAIDLIRRAAPVGIFELEVAARNTAALDLYQRRGFRVVQTIPVFRRQL